SRPASGGAAQAAQKPAEYLRRFCSIHRRPETGVYFRLRAGDFLLGLSAKERPMGSKRTARREFLRSGAALAGGFTLGAAAPALGQTPSSPPMIKGDKDQIAYGDRSR